MNPQPSYYTDPRQYQPPIKNDGDSQGIPTNEDFDSARNPYSAQPRVSPSNQKGMFANSASSRSINQPLNQAATSSNNRLYQGQITSPQRDSSLNNNGQNQLPRDHPNNQQANKKFDAPTYSFDQNPKSIQPQMTFQQSQLNRRSNQGTQEVFPLNQPHQRQPSQIRNPSGFEDISQYDTKQINTTQFDNYYPESALNNINLDNTYSDSLLPQPNNQAENRRKEFNGMPVNGQQRNNNNSTTNPQNRQAGGAQQNRNSRLPAGQDQRVMMMENPELDSEEAQRELAAYQFNSVSQNVNESRISQKGFNQQQKQSQQQQQQQQRLNYSGMYTYQNENAKTPQLNSSTSNAQLAYENPATNYDMYEQPSMIQQPKKLTPLEIIYIKEAQKIMNNEFFYKKLPVNYHSFVLPLNKRPGFRFFFMEFFLPIIIVFSLHVFLWGVQKSIDDFCFYGFNGCSCSNFATVLWTFFKQMLSWKLGVISCKKIILSSIIQEQNPVLESVMIYFFGIGIDFAMVAGIGLRMDWQFYVAMFIIGFIITLHSVKFNQLVSIWKHGKGVYSYDVNLALMVVFSYFVIPKIYSSLIDRYEDFGLGRCWFFYLYPLVEWVMEIYTSFFLKDAVHASFFQYQLQLFLLGLRVGIMTSVSSSTFEFWYLGVVFMLKRIFESTNILYIQTRKLIYEMFPQNLRYYVSMSEVPDYRKGSEGFILESIVWVAFYYFWWGTNTIVPASIKGSIIIVNDCSFSAMTLFSNITWDRPFFAWIFITSGQIIGLVLNSNLRFDMIKWVGAPQHNFIENVLTRMFGWYLFQVALSVCYTFSREELTTYTSF